MRWEDERYIKLYTRDTVDWLAMSFDAQAVLLLILRKVDRAGLLPLGKHGRRAVAIAVGHPEMAERIDAALEELLADGCVTIESDVLMVPNFLEAQEARQSNKQRQAELRARARDKAGLGDTDLSRGVTGCNAESHGSNAESHGITTRRDKTRRDKKEDPAPDGTGDRVQDILKRLDGMSGGGFVYSKPTKGQCIAVQRAIKECGEVDWENLAAYLKAAHAGRGGEPLGTPLLASCLCDRVAKAKRWKAAGCPAIGNAKPAPKSFQEQNQAKIDAEQDAIRSTVLRTVTDEQIAENERAKAEAAALWAKERAS